MKNFLSNVSTRKLYHTFINRIVTLGDDTVGQLYFLT